MRKSEILRLTWDRVDLKHGHITIRETKSGRPRTTSLVGEPLKILRERFLERSQESPYVFPAKQRIGYCICIRRAWNEACKRAGIKDLRVHDLRHTYCTLAAETGSSNLELATAMGHQTLQMFQRYTHLNAKVTHRLSSAVHEKILSKEHGENESAKTG